MLMNTTKIKRVIVMALPKPAILEQEMDRKEFLKNVGIGLLLLFGGNMIIGALKGLEHVNGSKQTSKSTFGYGGSKYGR